MTLEATEWRVLARGRFIIGAAMNLFNGMTHDQIISAVIMIALFSAFAGLVVIALAAFYVTARPRAGRIRTGAAWHLGALFWFLWANIACVWASPAENSLYSQTTKQSFDLGYARTQKVMWALGFAAVGCLCLGIGWIVSSGQARVAQRNAVTQREAVSQ